MPYAAGVEVHRIVADGQGRHVGEPVEYRERVLEMIGVDDVGTLQQRRIGKERDAGRHYFLGDAAGETSEDLDLMSARRETQGKIAGDDFRPGAGVEDDIGDEYPQSGRFRQFPSGGIV